MDASPHASLEVRGRAARRAPLAGLRLLVAFALAGCPRPVPASDGGPRPGEDGGVPDVDANYTLPQGNLFEGPIVFDDERVRALDPDLLRAGATPCRAPVLARVRQVIDGDTIQIRGEVEVLDFRVRMIGVDTPEISHGAGSDDCYGPESTAFSEQLRDRLVWLTFDNDCQDDFSRYLAYVHVGAGAGDLWERQLLSRGFATTLSIGGNRAYQPEFEVDERTALTADRGLWGACR